MSLERVADHECELGEGPVWHGGEERLYWVDITTGRLLRYDPSGDTSECVHSADTIGGFTVQRDGSLLLFMDRGRIRRWDGGELETVDHLLDSATRFNDVIADPAGRVFCGTMPSADHGGTLHRLDTDGTVTRIEEDVSIPNGMGFIRGRDRFYFTETEARTIHRYDYDESTGAVSDRKPFVTTPEAEGFPDGMTVDEEGCIWSARWEGGCVVRYDPEGSELERIPLPAEKVTSVAFGGPDLDELYVTTAGGDDRPTQGKWAGALFRLDPGVSGRDEFRSDLEL